jgi:hypothetical protein
VIIDERSLDAAHNRYPRANMARVRAWLAALPEPNVSLERKRKAARLLAEQAAQAA